MVKTYSDDLVMRWNVEIDTYLVYVSLARFRCRLLNSVDAIHAKGRPVFCNIDGIQRTVILTASAACSGLGLTRGLAANLFANEHLLRQPPIRQLNPGGLDTGRYRTPCPEYPPIVRLAEHALVLESHP